MITPKIDIMAALKAGGWSQYAIIKHHIMGASRITRLTRGEIPSYRELSWICEVLELQPGDVLQYVPGPDTAPGEEGPEE